MAHIHAEGETILGFGPCTVDVYGEKTVERVECDMRGMVKLIRSDISSGAGHMANGYHPEPGSMLQAYATLLQLFMDYRGITVEGDIGEIPMDDPDAIY